MENEIKSKKQVPVFVKILLGVVGVYLVVNFFGGAILGRGFQSEAVKASDARTFGLASMDYDEGSIMEEAVGMAEPMMAKSAPGGAMTSSMVKPMPVPPSRKGAPVPNVDKKIIKNGSVELKVDDAEKVADKITKIVKGLGGDIFSSSSRRQSNGSLRGSMIVKVPVDKFDEAKKSIKEAGEKVIFESKNTDDVTMEYIDLQARLNNKKAEEETFKNLLGRTGKLSDVLDVTRELTRVRSEIDSLEGQLKYMTAQTDMATINVTLTEFVQIATDRDSWKPWRTVTKSLHNLVLNTQNFIDDVIEFVLGGKLISLILTALLIFGAYKIVLKIYYKFKK